jgi:hypothetical protein
MDLLLSLWLPILASAVAVFFLGFVSHVVLPFHHGDWKKLPDEEGFISTMRAMKLPPGNYAFPMQRKGEAAKAPEYVQLLKDGPLGTISVWPGFAMGKSLALTFVWNALTTFFIAYLASITLPRGADFARVLQVVGTAGVLAHSFAQMPNLIWYHASTSHKAASVIDGIVFGLATGAIFAALWPAA